MMIFLFTWYLIGLVCWLLIALLDWYEGVSFDEGKFKSVLGLAFLGPISLIVIMGLFLDVVRFKIPGRKK